MVGIPHAHKIAASNNDVNGGTQQLLDTDERTVGNTGSIAFTSRSSTSRSVRFGPTVDANATILQLRYDFTNLERLSPLAKQFAAMQGDCSLTKVGLFHFDNFLSGLGSNLHVYSLGLCLALQMQNVRLRTHRTWVYRDVEACGRITTQKGTATSASESLDVESPMQCYFPQAEPICPGDITHHELTTSTKTFDITAMFSNVSEKKWTFIQRNSCPAILNGPLDEVSNIRAATTEYLFTRVSNLVQQEAERQLKILFGSNATAATVVKVPKNLITVHMRWGDKASEMTLVPTLEYIEAINDILRQRKSKNHGGWTPFLAAKNKNNPNDDDSVHIYLCTEDPLAVKHFMLLKPKHWNVYLDQYYVASLPNRMKIGNVDNPHVIAAEKFNGRTGLIALGSLLVAMEANDFVLTTASNWSRLMNEIRKNIINPRCNDCTKMIDLSYGEF